MEEVFDNVPVVDVPKVEKTCRDAGATDVKKEPQPDGSVKVTCIYPD